MRKPHLVLTLAVLLHSGAVRAEDARYTLRAGRPEGKVGTVRADNPAQGLTAWIGPESFRVTAAEAAAGSEAKAAEAWSVSFSLRRVGRGDHLAAVDAAGVESSGPRAELHRGALVEWYVNHPEGLEQGFDLATRPAGEADRVVVELAVATQGLLAVPHGDGAAVSFLRPGSRLPALRYGELAVRDAAGRLLPASMELGGQGGATFLRLAFDDHGARYPIHVDPLLTGAVWSSSESDATASLAWGDWDGDGDLDLAVGNSGQPNRVYENLGGTLETTAAWSSSESDDTSSVAWGDWDGDGDLDLAVGNVSQPNRVYENLGGALETTAAWSSSESDDTFGVAWGDWDGDGDLDLAVGNESQPTRVYENLGGTLETTASWSELFSQTTFSLAWGDWDGDGDLDLAAGGYGRVYENLGGTLSTTAVWSPSEPSIAFSVAWGDWDGDGDLDLATANFFGPNRVYENTGGTLATTAIWSSSESDHTQSVAWGDWDGDGDLDLAAGNYSEPNRVYENTSGTLATTATWSSSESDHTFGVAWGDWDGDGDLDLATAENGPNHVYENTGGTLATTAVWSSSESDGTLGVAWGDWDGDGDLDLAAGNFPDPNRVYENTGGTLATAAAWSSSESDDTLSVAWGDWDGDGDLDLAAGNFSDPNRVYENTGGSLATTAAWSSSESDNTYGVAWGDWDGDGDLDLAAGNVGPPTRVYLNGSVSRPMHLPETPVSPVIKRRPGGTDAAAAYSGECLESPDPALDYSLVDEEDDAARRLELEYAVDGEVWLPATLAAGGTQELSAGPSGMPHQLIWDNLADGVVRAPEVRLRVTVPFQASTRLAGPIQRAAMRAVSPAFSLCIPAADLAVSLDDGAASATPGETVSYTLTVANAGPDDATGVRVEDTFPAALAGVTWSCATGGGGGACGAAGGGGDLDESVDLPAGGSVVFTVDATVDPAATGTLTHTASAALPSGLTEITTTDNSATDSDVLVPSSDLSITNDDGTATEVPGATATYTVEVANAGPSDAFAAQVVDAFPPIFSGVLWTCVGTLGGTCAASGYGDIEESVDLPVGAKVTFTVDGAVDPAATGTLITSATVYPTFPSALTNPPAGSLKSGGDPDPGNNNAVDADVLTPEADLAIAVDDGTPTALLGEEVTYTIEVSNAGPSTVSAATVDDAFPVDLVGVGWTCAGSGGGSCTASGSGDVDDAVDLPSGASVTYTATATLDAGSAAATLANTATVSAPGSVTETHAADNTSTDTDNVLPPAIFSDGFESGDTLVWSASVP